MIDTVLAPMGDSVLSVSSVAAVVRRENARFGVERRGCFEAVHCGRGGGLLRGLLPAGTPAATKTMDAARSTCGRLVSRPPPS
jgi:hypothetical protein